MSDGWSLHPQLEQDTTAAGDLTLSRLLVLKDANYPWLVLVPRRAGASEIIDLDAAAQAQLWVEITDVSRALKTLTGCDKLNVAAIGNVVPQLHVHVVARRKSDAAWPRPVWGAVPPLGYEPAALEAFAGAVRKALQIG